MESPQEKEISCDTLRILHLPSYLSNCQREKLLKKYGAVDVRTINKSEKYAETFAKFASEQAATRAFIRLHQLRVRGRRLGVEYARKRAAELCDNGNNNSENVEDRGSTEEPETIEPNFRSFLKRLNGWAFSQVLTQPPPPNIRYKYSPPTTGTVLRIAIQMLKEPIFYCQVLHLMNKMNLPPPFQELEHEFPFLRDVYDPERYRDVFESTVVANKNNEQESEEDAESELETDEDTERRPEAIVPTKRKRAQSSKRLKIPKFINLSKQMSNASSTSQKSVKPEDVFESTHLSETKSLKIALKVDSDMEKRFDTSGDADPSTSSATAITSQEEGGFGLLYPIKKSCDGTEENQDSTRLSPEFVACEELAANRISVHDQRLLPVFKNYHPGKPSCRLYIKNLSKQVETKDLDFIYKRFATHDSKNKDEDDSPYNIRLMQEGRMKGQAFVTLPSIEQAQSALEETNGYIFKGKPMVVQFAKFSNK